jgi:hypothetical protein
MRIKITFLKGPEVVAEVEAIRDVDLNALSILEMEQIIPTEALLEKLTGLRVHIEQK